MATMMEKYAATLKLICDVPLYNRQRAIKRFFLLMYFEECFDKVKVGTPKSPINLTHFLIAFCKKYKLSETTFWRWRAAFKKKGIRGLVPTYGSSAKHLYRQKNKKMVATITIDPKAPLNCLKTINKIIEHCKLIDPRIKAASLLLLKHYFTASRCTNQLSLNVPLTDDEIQTLKHYKAGMHKKYCKKAVAILLANDMHSLLEAMEGTHAAEGTIYRWLRNFNQNRLESIEVHVHAPEREERQAERQRRILDIVHKMPSLYGINRTTWTYGAIAQAYIMEYGLPIQAGMIKMAIQRSGYKWQRARRVLMSPDPHYREKVQRLLDTLQGLKDSDLFFFIDEAGPYKVKKYGGKVLRPEGHPDNISANQKSRGHIQFAAALEAVGNQMTWIFSRDKSSATMLQLLSKICENYHTVSRIYLTWDAITMHYSQAVTKWVEQHNQEGQGPAIEIVPLPTSAQFLNVIEAVFSGMKRAVIFNSDYVSEEDMQHAISLHFEERNAFYRANPKRAGNKIWDKQVFDLDKLAGGLFRRM